MSEQLRLASDIGGTFTDMAVFDETSGKLRFGKALSTPQHLVEGINNGVAKAGADYKSVGLFLHGSTIAINTILERRGAKTALLITKGFRDIYEIGRINRPDSYNLFFKKHEPLVERALRFEVNERILADGEIEKPLDDKEIEALGDKIAGLGIEAVAILFLHCYRNPDHEQRAKAILQKRHPDDVRLGEPRAVSQEYREFERCSTVVANAYIGPSVDNYLGGIDDHIAQGRLQRLVPDRAIDRRALRVETGAAILRSHAGIGAGGGRHRHAHAVPHARPQERDRFRHGRHHGEGRRHP